MIRTSLPARLTPLADELGLIPLYGDIHNHCDLSYGHGSCADALARAALQLDFVSITGHAHWPDMPVDDPRVADIVDFHVKGFAKLRRCWAQHFNTLAQANTQKLIVFPGYEIHSNAFGDYTIVYRALAPAPLVLADSPSDLHLQLRATIGEGALAFPHHIAYRLGARGINWPAFDPALSPFVEINSMHGCAETSEVDRPYLHSMGPSDGEGTMAHGLSQGHVFGIVGNTDHHSAFPGSYGHGRMAVYARQRDRTAVWEAMRARRTNALTGANIHLLAAIGAAVQGSTMPPQTSAFLGVEAVAGGFIDCIDIVRNGRLFHRISPELTPAPLSSGLETILYLELGWGARGRSHRWDGRIEIDGGEILSVEPRFRGAEIVSPLDGSDEGDDLPTFAADGHALTFSVTAQANPNNATVSTQGFALSLRLDRTANIRAALSGQRIEIPAERLFRGAKSGNLGPIDSPAWRFHALPLPRQWQWKGAIQLGSLAAGETIYARLRQSDGQMAWTSPLYCRMPSGSLS